MEKKGQTAGVLSAEKSKRCKWSESCEIALLALWLERVGEFRGLKRNGHILAEISKDLSAVGYDFKVADIRTKMQTMTKRYKKEKAMVGPSGGTPSDWIHYEIMQQILSGDNTMHFEDLTIDSIANTSLSFASFASTSMSEQPGSGSATPLSPAAVTKKDEALRIFQTLADDIAEHFANKQEIENERMERERERIERERGRDERDKENHEMLKERNEREKRKEQKMDAILEMLRNDNKCEK